MIAFALAALLPTQLAPPDPFPHVITSAPSIAQVAPGVEYGEYDLFTSAGPIVVHALAVAPHAPNVTLNSVLADDALQSPGETLSSMAQRTGAIGGINGDYFDIGNTNRPTNIVVRGGALLRTPRKRYALVIASDGSPHIVEEAFSGTVTVAGHRVSLDAVNEMPPPDGGTALLTPAFGSVAPAPNVTLIALAPSGGTPPFTAYTVTDVADETVREPAGYYLAVGLNAYGSTGVPNPGDSVTASGDLSAVPLAQTTAAVGGGPLLLDAGAPVVDPDGPNGAEFALRIPASGAGIAADGTLYLVEVDGREPEHSVGVTRPEFAAVMRALGAVRAMAFDGGGSSELVARTPTDERAELQNDPSDGRERKIADGIFVYDNAPPGPPEQIETAPQTVRAMPGARVALRVALADHNDRVAPGGAFALRVEPADLGSVDDGAFIAAHAGDGSILVSSGAMTASIAVHVEDDPARVEILPGDPSAAVNASLTLHARAFDAQGYALALPTALPWRALHGSIDANGTLTVGDRDALVSLLLGDHLADATVAVGFHDVALSAPHPHVMTVPRGGDADVAIGEPCPECMTLRYALGESERAAYLTVETPLPQHAVAIAFDVDDDGKGALLKLALRNAIDEEVLLPAGRLVHEGWKHVEVRLPATLAQPARLTAVYVIAPAASESIEGTIAIRNLHAIAAGQIGARP